MPSKNQDLISIKGASQHNLKNVDVDIVRNSFTVVTGVSGSGKSSLVFDTLFAEGQRRYVESLSSYARQFLGKLEKPKVDSIDGLAPSIAIEQKVNTRNPRSTVATSTEIYDYLKLLFSRVGKTFSPISGKEVVSHSTKDVLTFAETLPNESMMLVLAPVVESYKDTTLLAKHYANLGFARLLIDGETKKSTDLAETKGNKYKKALVVVDRIEIDQKDEDWKSRLAESVETAFWESKGSCIIQVDEKDFEFNNRFEADGLTFEIPTENFLSYNNPYGACKTCEGFGSVLGIDEDLVVPDKSLSVHDGAVMSWKGETMSEWRLNFIKNAIHADFPVHRAYMDLSETEKELLWQGKGNIKGINDFFKFVESQTYKIQYRVMLSRYRGKTRCPDCKGTRLRKDANNVKLVNENETDKKHHKLSISDVILMNIAESLTYFKGLKLEKTSQKIADRIIEEVVNRLQYLNDVGLGYLALSRLSNSLSGGESQRINLATSLGSSLVGSTYVLDEPSIGLHPKDTERLISVLKNLQSLGNTVVIVEHDEEVMRASDNMIDMGPFAGEHGGEVIFNGSFDKMLKSTESLTAKYLTGKENITKLSPVRNVKDSLEIIGAQENNLKAIDVTIPLNMLTCVTGVSGSGKTSLVKGILYPALSKRLGNYVSQKTGKFKSLDGDVHLIENVEMIDQNPIGKSSRSNPVTYVKAYDAIRDLFANLPGSKAQKLRPQHFSFNVDGGRCDNCKGEGEITIEMQFMADIHLLCEVCNGKKFKEEILEVKYKKHSISDVLDLSVDEALLLFAEEKSILTGLQSLADVGLGYIRLGQSSNTLSGGEAQRVKLASFLGKGASRTKKGILFIFDEPTTGLHFHDIKKLLASFEALIEKGHTVLVIEHNMDLVKCADYIIDIGPEGGDKGGYLLYQGAVDGILKVKESYTAQYLSGLGK